MVDARRSTVSAGALAVLLLVAPGTVAADPATTADPRLSASVGREAAAVGDRVPLTLTLEPGGGRTFEPRGIGPELGPFRVAGGTWSREDTAEGATRWTWAGAVAAFETGDLEVPGIRLEGTAPDGTRWSVESDPIAVRIDSVLAGEGALDELDIADLKAPVSLPPDWRTLGVALGAVVALLALAGLVAWVHRRWSRRAATVVPPPDPFDRLPPHEWAFRELKALLAERLHERGEVARFHEFLARIVKTYLEGRYRVDLLERTTAEVGPALRAAGAPEGPATRAIALLHGCDGVKFAGDRPDAASCRATVEIAYDLIDETRPAARDAAEEGAA